MQKFKLVLCLLAVLVVGLSSALADGGGYTPVFADPSTITAAATTAPTSTTSSRSRSSRRSTSRFSDALTDAAASGRLASDGDRARAETRDDRGGCRSRDRARRCALGDARSCDETR